MSPPLLTIAIPTFNGEHFIREALESIWKQLEFDLVDLVEVCVSDNASTDSTEEIVKIFKEDHQINLTYVKNITNIGFDRNYDCLFKIATGEYVWPLADDDLLEPGSIRRIIHILRSNKDLKIIQVNFKKYDRALMTVTDEVQIENDWYGTDYNLFFSKSKGRWGAMSSLILHRKSWDEIDISFAYNSHIIFAFGAFAILKNGASFISRETLVKVRDGSEKVVQFGDGDARILIALASGKLYLKMLDLGYSETLIRAVLKDDRKYVFNSIPLAKFWGIRNKADIVRELCSVHDGVLLRIKWIPIIYCPDSIYRIYYRARKAASSKLRPIESRLKRLLKK